MILLQRLPASDKSLKFGQSLVKGGSTASQVVPHSQSLSVCWLKGRMTEPHKIRIEQCEAAEGIEDEFGTQKALEYLVGEKF